MAVSLPAAVPTSVNASHDASNATSHGESSSSSSSSSSTGVCIYASAAVYGRAYVMRALLADADRFLQPCLTVIHVSRGSEALSSRSLPNPRTMLINRERRHVERQGPTKLAAHLRNWALIAATARPAANDKIVLLAGNQRFFRSCRAHILQTDMSFMLGELADLRCPDCDRGRGTKRPIQFPSREFEKHRRGVFAQNDGWMDRQGYHRPFVSYMRRLLESSAHEEKTHMPAAAPKDTDRGGGSSAASAGTADRTITTSTTSHGNSSSIIGTASSVWRPRPLGMMPHEGSFYPWFLLRDFMRDLESSGLFVVDDDKDEKDEPNASSALPPSSSRGSSNGSVGGGGEGGEAKRGGGKLMPTALGKAAGATSRCSWPCEKAYPEEVLLPTYIWQQHMAGLLRTATFGPPIVTRVWLRGHSPHNMTAAMHPLEQWLRPAQQFEYICAVKYPQRQLYVLP